MSKYLRDSKDLASLSRKIGLTFSILLIAFVIFLITASKAEESDSFCIACHTLPEQTYFDRAELARDLSSGPGVDLASAHTAAPGSFKCIDCHRGESTLNDRATTLTLGARDAAIFISGQADQTIEKGHTSQTDLLNRACWQCHQDRVLVAGFNNHFHNQLAVAAPSQPASSVGCADCHQAHIQMDSGAEQVFLNIEEVVYPACEKCHRELQLGPQTLSP